MDQGIRTKKMRRGRLQVMSTGVCAIAPQLTSKSNFSRVSALWPKTLNSAPLDLSGLSATTGNAFSQTARRTKNFMRSRPAPNRPPGRRPRRKDFDAPPVLTRPTCLRRDRALTRGSWDVQWARVTSHRRSLNRVQPDRSAAPHSHYARVSTNANPRPPNPSRGVPAGAPRRHPPALEKGWRLGFVFPREPAVM